MTAIAIWFNDENPEKPSLWVASDSLVSNEGSPLIKNAVKIFMLPVVCRYPDKDNNFISKIASYHSYGYCFAGNTLLGQNTLLALMPLLSNLDTNKPYIPQMQDVAIFILPYLDRAFDEYKIIVREKSFVEIALFGWCHVTKKYYIFHYYPKKDDNDEYKITLTMIDKLDKKSFLYLGDKRDEITAKINEAFAEADKVGRVNASKLS